MKKIWLFTFLSVLIDQVIKIFVSYNLNVGESISVINNFFNITCAHNIGAAFSIFNGGRIIFIILAIIALNLIYIFFIHKKELDNKEKILYSLLIGGILGNLLDRLFYGYVIDYLDFNIFGYNFPIFNFADILITISVILILIFSIKEKHDSN